MTLVLLPPRGPVCWQELHGPWAGCLGPGRTGPGSPAASLSSLKAAGSAVLLGFPGSGQGAALEVSPPWLHTALVGTGSPGAHTAGGHQGRARAGGLPTVCMNPAARGVCAVLPFPWGKQSPRIELALELGAGSFSAPAGPRAYAPDMTRWVRPPWGPFRMHRPRTSTGEGVRGRAGRGDSAIVSQATLCDACPAPNHANSLSHPGTPHAHYKDEQTEAPSGTMCGARQACSPLLPLLLWVLRHLSWAFHGNTNFQPQRVIQHPPRDDNGRASTRPPLYLASHSVTPALPTQDLGYRPR